MCQRLCKETKVRNRPRWEGVRWCQYQRIHQKVFAKPENIIFVYVYIGKKGMYLPSSALCDNADRKK